MEFTDNYGILEGERGKRYADFAPLDESGQKKGQAFFDAQFASIYRALRVSTRLPPPPKPKFPPREWMSRDWWDDESLFGSSAWTIIDGVSDEYRRRWGTSELSWTAMEEAHMQDKD